jgi:hypothetical protein
MWRTTIVSLLRRKPSQWLLKRSFADQVAQGSEKLKLGFATPTHALRKDALVVGRVENGSDVHHNVDMIGYGSVPSSYWNDGRTSSTCAYSCSTETWCGDCRRRWQGW